MKIDFATLAFGYKVKSGGNTPNWATSLGQGKGYKINENAEIDEIIRGMVYSAVPVTYTKTKIGKGGGFSSGKDENSPITLASVFRRVFINDKLIKNGKFILLIIKDLSGYHSGRLKLKYAPSNSYEDSIESFSNTLFFDQVREQLGLSQEACWFVSEINVRNQEELVLKTIFVDKEKQQTYESRDDLHQKWSSLSPIITPYKSEYDKKSKVGDNIIFYGVPGCGKSYKIKKDYCDSEEMMERIVFHPDYTFSDFVGQILPVNEEGHISYLFVPGPFTRILKKAYDDPDYNYYLIIEELNRGNAPAIFGEVFQLLDRIEGISEYGINNTEISKAVYGDPNHLIKLPKNLFILATMNTADQNVFTLDTAFKRRWKMVNVISDVSKSDNASIKIGKTEVTWSAFLNTINPVIIECGGGRIGSEDKRLGAYFVGLKELKDQNYFGEKVLMYLWNDAFRFDHEKVFKQDYKTLEELIAGFRDNGFSVFADNIEFKTE